MLAYSFHISQFISFPGKTQVWLNSYPEYNKIIIKILGYFYGVTRFIEDLSRLVAPMTKLTRKEVKFE